MADDKKTPASAKKPKTAAKPAKAEAAKAEPAKAEAKAEAKPAAPKPAAVKPAKAAKTEGKTGAKTARSMATPAVADGPACRVEGCRQPVRAKGYCRKHFIAWRRADLGDHHRYKICSKEGCRKPRAVGGLCDEHAGTAAAAPAASAEGAAPA
jgi:outer membrane biosynthesis protein TonB